MKLPQLENSSCLRTGSILTCVPAAQKSRDNATRPSSCWDVFGRIDNSGSAHSLAAAIWTISSSCGNTLQARVVLLLRTGADWSRSPAQQRSLPCRGSQLASAVAHEALCVLRLQRHWQTSRWQLRIRIANCVMGCLIPWTSHFPNNGND